MKRDCKDIMALYEHGFISRHEAMEQLVDAFYE